jgi:hypothetical protein
MTDISQEFFYFIILIIIVVFVDIIFGAWQLKKVKKFIKNSLKTRAVVTDYNFIRDGKNSHHEVTFEFKNNKCETFISKSRAMKKYRKNDKIEILYSKSDPNDNKINSFQVLYLLPFMLIVVTPIVKIGLVVFLYSNGGF